MSKRKQFIQFLEWSQDISIEKQKNSDDKYELDYNRLSETVAESILLLTKYKLLSTYSDFKNQLNCLEVMFSEGSTLAVEQENEEIVAEVFNYYQEWLYNLYWGWLIKLKEKFKGKANGGTKG